MTKAELINKVHYSCRNRNLSKALINEVVDCCFTEMGKGIKKDKRFTYPNFGTWTVKNRKARIGRNPQTGEEIKIAASKTVTFRPSQSYKDNL